MRLSRQSAAESLSVRRWSVTTPIQRTRANLSALADKINTHLSEFLESLFHARKLGQFTRSANATAVIFEPLHFGFCDEILIAEHASLDQSAVDVSPHRVGLHAQFVGKLLAGIEPWQPDFTLPGLGSCHHHRSQYTLLSDIFKQRECREWVVTADSVCRLAASRRPDTPGVFNLPFRSRQLGWSESASTPKRC